MSIRRLPAILLLPLIILVSFPAQAFVGGIAVSLGRATNTEGAKIPPFSADAQIESGEYQVLSRVYYQPGMVRDEADMGGMQVITIQRFDTGKVWVLMGEGMYMETEIGEAQQAPDYQLVERTLQGTEVINGEETSRYKTVYEGPEGRFEGLTWFTRDNIAVKGSIVSESQGEQQQLEWTMSNVQRGEQPDEFFELPPGAQPMGNMGGFMDMMKGGAATEGSDPGTDEQNAEDALLEGVKSLGELFGN